MAIPVCWPRQAEANSDGFDIPKRCVADVGCNPFASGRRSHEVLRSKKLFTDQFVVAIAKNHVHVEDTISFDKLCDMRYVETRFGGVIAGVSEQLWQQQPKQPHTCAWLPNFQLTLDTVGQTDMATILPSLLVRLQGERYKVRSLPVPFDMPVLEERLYWHRRNDNDAGHSVDGENARTGGSGSDHLSTQFPILDSWRSHTAPIDVRLVNARWTSVAALGSGKWWAAYPPHLSRKSLIYKLIKLT